MRERKKQALCIATVASNLDNFNRNNVDILLDMGYEVTLAANFHTKEDINSQEKIDAFAKEMRAKGVHITSIDFSRKISKINNQIQAIMQVKKLLNRGFDLVHCHSPICAAIVRAEAQKYRKKNNLKVLYTAHGFHFYKGAPLKNWMIFYPIERWLSRYTDVLITINKEDYKRAKEHFKAKKTVYIPGVGVDTEKFKPEGFGREKIRKELGLDDSRIMLLSVGELNENKNHIAVIDAIKDMPGLTYVIAGIGDLKDKLEQAARESGVDLRLMGYRNDVTDLYDAADVYVLPSIREGLNVSLMEAMASGLPVACGRIRGNIDLIDDDRVLFAPTSTAEIRSAIGTAIENKEILGDMNLKKIRSFDLTTVEEQMSKTYFGGGMSI